MARNENKGRSNRTGGFKKSAGSGRESKPGREKPTRTRSTSDRSERGGSEWERNKRADGKADKPVSRERATDRPKRTEGREDKPFTRGSDRNRTGGGRESKSFSRERGGDRNRTEDREERTSSRERGGERKPFSRERGEGRDRDEKTSGREKRSYGEKSERPFSRDKREGDRSERSDDRRPARKTGKPFVRKSDGDFDEFEDDLSPGSGARGGKRDRSEKTSSPKEKSTTRRTSVDDGSIRLNKYIANAGICSRREADQLITSGVVSVNGKPITEMGYKVKPGDIVRYNNETLQSERKMYVLLNKPKDYITTLDDPEGRKTVFELIRGVGKERIYPVGRLDRATTGVLLFTNDGDLAKRLTHPKYEVQKIYHVELDKNVKPSDIERILTGVELEDGFIKADDVAYVGDGQDKKQVGVELHSGRNRIVRRLFEHLGYNVRKLDRVTFAGLTKKDLPRGRWRHLTEKEVGMLYMLSTTKVR